MPTRRAMDDPSACGGLTLPASVGKGAEAIVVYIEVARCTRFTWSAGCFTSASPNSRHPARSLPVPRRRVLLSPQVLLAAVQRLFTHEASGISSHASQWATNPGGGRVHDECRALYERGTTGGLGVNADIKRHVCVCVCRRC